MGLTLKQLIDCYRTDPYSNFLRLQHQVRRKHDGELTRLIERYGSTQLCDIRLEPYWLGIVTGLRMAR
jgi:hypothetical protein